VTPQVEPVNVRTDDLSARAEPVAAAFLRALASATPDRVAVAAEVTRCLAALDIAGEIVHGPLLGDADPSRLIDLDPAQPVHLLMRSDKLTEQQSLFVEAARLAFSVCAFAEQAEAADSEVESLRTVATRILAAQGLDEALAGVTHETLALLDADIAGVMLRSGDEIHMRGCVGNQRMETARLTMRRGQGLAGRVFATGRPERVDDYLASQVISDDFHALAREERTRCAMGAPIVVDNEIIGVLEVWRRTSVTFSDQDTRRLVALADLAAIAFENARLYESNRESLAEVERAHEELAGHLTKVEKALAVQQQVIEGLIAGNRLPDLIRTIADTAECHAKLFDPDFELLASFPEADTSDQFMAHRRPTH
jgi:putative methionine-R-sulfoxide reductase with GAF domain